MTNEEVIQKTLETSDLINGGQLNPEQQTEFIKLARDNSVMLKMVRVETVDNPKVELDRMHIGEPVTESADENTDGSGETGKPKFDKIAISTKKVRSSWNISTEALQSNITKEQLEQQIMEGMSKRIGTDMELLAIRGDSAITGTTRLEKLLKRADGWDKKTNGVHIVDVGGSSISKGVFAEMIRAMPEQYLNDPDLRFFVSKVISVDWLDLVADRLTAVGDEALKGRGTSPYGIPLVEVPLIPSTKDVTVVTATSGWAMGVEFGPFVVTATAKTLKIDVDNAGAVEFSLTPGTLQLVEVCRQINAALGKSVARDNGYGQLILESPTTGATSEIDLQTPSANSAMALLGLTVGVNAGVAAGTGDTVAEGSFIWLANPKNFIQAILAGTRVYSKFNQDYDRIEVRVYNQVDMAVENPDAIVKAINIRRRSL
jgi:hypothetical protein